MALVLLGSEEMIKQIQVWHIVQRMERVSWTSMSSQKRDTRSVLTCLGPSVTHFSTANLKRISMISHELMFGWTSAQLHHLSVVRAILFLTSSEAMLIDKWILWLPLNLTSSSSSRYIFFVSATYHILIIWIYFVKSLVLTFGYILWHCKLGDSAVKFQTFLRYISCKQNMIINIRRYQHLQKYNHQAFYPK